jgi:hypothetical protein
MSDEPLLAGENAVVAEAHRLPVTEWATASMTPHEWLEVADFLGGILGRPPLRDGAGWAAHRVILGALASELRAEAIAAGEPPEPPVELPPEWVAWDKDMAHEWSVASNADVHRRPRPLTSDRATAAPVGGQT